MKTTRSTHSVSSCREYELCPRRYRFAYVDREPARRHVPPSWRVGSAVHEALEAAYRHRQVRGGEGPMDECVPAATAALHHAWKRLELDGKASLAESVGVVRRFLGAQDVSGEEILGVEQLLATTTPEGLRIAGYADLVLRRETAIEIRDHKVTRWERTEADLASDFQLNLYGWLAKQMWPWATDVRAAHSYPLSGRIVAVELEPGQMDDAAAHVRTTAAAIAEDVEFDANPGEHCASCAWASLCPEAAA
jgi:putative RecB family exonuclease